ncbi:MAG: FliM/FliN family flagellar motor switch protein [Firmicutes bacterium]|nr:FliM/FliN family flagellar motor switch protein [Bacillota bacterium]
MAQDDHERSPGGGAGDGPLSQAEIDALLAALTAASSNPAPAPTTAAAPPAEQALVSSPAAPEAVEEASAPAPTPTRPAVVLDPALARFERLTMTFSASIGTARIFVRDWLSLGVGSRLVLESLPHQAVSLKLNGVTVGVGRVVLVNNTLGVEVVEWGRRGR